LDYLEFNRIIFVSKPGFGLAHQHLGDCNLSGDRTFSGSRYRPKGARRLAGDFERRYATPSLRSFYRKRDLGPIDLRASDDCDGVSFCG
jgi:hypothetical protein